MKKANAIAAMICFIALAVGAAGLPQDNTDKSHFVPTFDPNDVVQTQTGDTLWGYSNDQYDRLIAMNSEYNLQKVVRGPGDIYVKLPVGIMIKGVKREYGSVQNSPTPTPVPSPSPSPSPEGNAFGIFGLVPPIPGWFPWALILLLAAIIAYLWFQNWFQNRRRGAATAGPKYAESGVNDGSVHAEFARQARASYPGEASLNDFRVENVRRRKATGAIVVHYNNGTSQVRYLDNETVFIADLRYPDGTVRRDEMMLAACGNPLRYGNVTRYAPGIGFRFVDDNPITVKAPTQQAQTEMAARADNPLSGVKTSVVFKDNTAVITTNGKSVEMATEEATTFANVASKTNVNLPVIEVKHRDVTLQFQDGILTVLEKAEEPTPEVAEPAKEEASKTASATAGGETSN